MVAIISATPRSGMPMRSSARRRRRAWPSGSTLISTTGLLVIIAGLNPPWAAPRPKSGGRTLREGCCRTIYASPGVLASEKEQRSVDTDHQTRWPARPTSASGSRRDISHHSALVSIRMDSRPCNQAVGVWSGACFAERRPVREPQFPAEQFHALIAPNNAMRLSRIEWLWSSKSVSGSPARPRRVDQEDPPMRIYIIGNDGITLCREPPATVDKGEIAVASREELHAARLSGKRLLALWNALPGVEKQTKVGDREALIDQLWSAIEALPDPDQQSDAKRPSKQQAVIAMLQRPEGATVDEVASTMGWQRHTVRGLFSGTLKKKLGLTLASATEERGRVYRIVAPEQA